MTEPESRIGATVSVAMALEKWMEGNVAIVQDQVQLWVTVRIVMDEDMREI